MTHTLPTPTATPPTARAMLEEVLDLGGGLVVALLPLFVLSVPGIVLFVLLPAVLLAAVAVPLALIGALVAGPPYLLFRRFAAR